MSQKKLKRCAFKSKRRRWEFDLITSAIKDVIPIEQIGKLRVLEFGSGPSGGAQYLCQIGDIVVTDIYEHPLLNLPPGVEFRIADIQKTDFSNGEFDILVSNQVLEHLKDLRKAFREMKRIGKENAYYAFGVPTATWLILTIPGQIFKKFENISMRIKAMFGKPNEAWPSESDESEASADEETQSKNSWLSKFMIYGHGCYPCFFQCLKFFRIRNWEKIIVDNGLEIVKRIPLLTYGSSHFSIIPMNRFLAKCGLSSSYLFICKKSPGSNE
jgi:SAM-dependent methyltransferase